MSKTSLFLLAGIVSLFVISLVNIFRRPSTPSTTSEVVQTLTPRENSGGDVDVRVTPKVLNVGEKPQFDLEFNTHSVELDFDVASVSSLSDAQGSTYGTPLWEGSPPGGHHRSGSLTFPELLRGTKSITLTLRDISVVTSREFSWQL